MPLIVSGCTWVSIHITCISTKIIRHSSGCPSIVPPSLNRFYWLLLNNNNLNLGLLPDSVPIFTPNPIGHSGLDILAAAALTGKTPGCTLGAVAPQAPHPNQMLLSMPGPYNPATTISAKVARRILELEFVEMAEISADDDLPQANGRPASSSRPPITNISQWLERYSVMAAILATRFPEKAPEVLVYQAAIIRAERNYKGKQWVTYDRQYRREALARKDLNWSIPNVRLYNEAFTGRAKAIPRCSYCLQDDHPTSMCPRNPVRQLAWDMPMWTAQPAPGFVPRTTQMDICRNFNEGRCKRLHCWYQHICLGCQEPHAVTNCPRRRQPQMRGPRSRSPVRRPSFGQRP